MPAAEVSVSPELVRRLLAVQHPEFAQLPVEVLANGWDNLSCRLGDALLVRLPRRAVAARLLANEQRWLPVLAPALPLPVPAPVRTGRGALGYPWSWSIVPYLPGDVAACEPPADLAAAAASLGGFLGALHVPARAEAPVNPVRGVPLAARADAVAENLDLLGTSIDRAAVRRRWDAALATPAWGGPAVWLHGDLHPANILVDHGRISAVIDFGDITAGDPAGDLSAAWMLLPARHHRRFQDAYLAASEHGDDEALWARARGWALVLSLAFLAHSADNPLMAGIGRRTLDAVLA